MHLSEAFHQDALERDNEINKITPDPVLPCLGGIGPVASAIANPVPGHASLGDKVLPAPGNTFRRNIILGRG